MPYEGVDSVSFDGFGKAVGWFQPADADHDITTMKNKSEIRFFFFFKVYFRGPVEPVKEKTLNSF